METIPLVDLKEQYRRTKAEIDSAIAGVLADGRFIQGPDVRRFEEEFAEYCGADYAVGVASGTAALQLALWAYGVRQGDEVITTPFTFAATIEAIIWAGATPVLVDIDPVTYNIDPDRVEAAVTERTRAVLPVHLYGHPASMDPLVELAQSRGITLIEDSAQAHGAEHRGRRVGSIGDAGAFSFFPAKNLGAYGDGGMMTTNDPEIADRVRRLRDHGREGKYTHVEVGLGERLDTLQAAILRVKLRHLEGWTEDRRRIAALYDDLLGGSSLVAPVERDYARHVYHLYVVRVPHRDEVAGLMQERGIGVGVHYPIPAHLQPAFSHLGYRKGELPVSERAAAEVLSLPLFPELRDDQVSRVVTTLHEVLAGSGEQEDGPSSGGKK